MLGYFGLFDLGLSRATVKFVAENAGGDRVKHVPSLVWTSLFLLVSIGGLGGLLCAALVSAAVVHVFKMPPSYTGEAKLSLYILCASLPVMLASDALRGVIEGAQRFDLVNYVKVPASISFYLLTAFAVFAK